MCCHEIQLAPKVFLLDARHAGNEDYKGAVMRKRDETKPLRDVDGHADNIADEVILRRSIFTRRLMTAIMSRL